MHEASLWDANCFITLTYDDDHKPLTGSLVKSHFQDFMKRLRYYHPNDRIRYYMVGEYGEELQRPHYHALLFNFDFIDKRLWSRRNNVNTYVSDHLEKVWGKGFATVGDLTFESAAYCTRYCLKKINGDLAEDHYWHQATETVAFELEPEYSAMSLKPAIGKEWFQKFKGDCYPSDFITANGIPQKIPKYYDALLERENPKLYKQIKRKRLRAAQDRAHDYTPERLRARETVAKARYQQLPRFLEANQ